MDGITISGELRLDQRTPWFPYLLTNGFLMPVHRRTIETHGDDWTRAENLVVSGASSRRGNIAAMGLVPKSARLPPAAGIAAGELPNASPTMRASATGARCQAATPK